MYMYVHVYYSFAFYIGTLGDIYVLYICVCEGVGRWEGVREGKSKYVYMHTCDAVHMG